MGAPGKPDIRGQQRSELVNDLASGELTHTQLAEKYDRHPQAIAQFAVRNRGEINVVKAAVNKAIHERLGDIAIAYKGRRIAVNQLLRDDLLEQLENPELDADDRARYVKTVLAFQRYTAEELGDLRNHVEVTANRNVLSDFNEFVIDADGTFHPLAGSNVNGPDTAPTGQR